MLVDENISRTTVKFLKDRGYDVKTVFDFNLEGVRNSKLVETSLKEDRIIVTLDAILGYRYYFLNRGKLGIILLRLSDLTVENINQKLKQLFDSLELEKEGAMKNLIIVSDEGFEIFR